MIKAKGHRTNLKKKSSQNFPKTNTLTCALACSYHGVKNFSFWKIFHASFPCNNWFDIHLLNFVSINWKLHELYTWTKSLLYCILLLYKKMQNDFMYSIDRHFLFNHSFSLSNVTVISTSFAQFYYHQEDCI